MQHRIKGQLLLDGPSYSVRANHPIATRLWSDGYSFRTSVGRWAVLIAIPPSDDPDGGWRIYASLNVARFTSRSKAVRYARRVLDRRSHPIGSRSRVVRWRRWMTVPRGIVPVELHIERWRRIARLLGMEG